jgi:hypothetical protein
MRLQEELLQEQAPRQTKSGQQEPQPRENQGQVRGQVQSHLRGRQSAGRAVPQRGRSAPKRRQFAQSGLVQQELAT